MRIMLAGVILVCLIPNLSAAQQIEPDSLVSISPEDSARIVGSFLRAEARRTDTLSSAHKSTKSPGLALLFSAVLPGAGQLYNESYWKVPILLGFGYYFARQWIDNNDSTRHYRNLFSGSITAEAPSGNSRYLQLREFYKNQRDTFSWYIFIYYIVNLVDAYVDASLYDFNVGDDLSIRLMPEFTPMHQGSAQLKLNIRF